MTKEEIINLLPYSPPFLFVDDLEELTENGVKGSYTYPKNSFFYEGHFKDYPITPGVILTETMAQIGLVCLGIYLLKDKIAGGEKPGFVMVASETEYFLPVFPREKVLVASEKIYFRFGKLKCKVQMWNEKGGLVCEGVLQGMMVDKKNGE